MITHERLIHRLDKEVCQAVKTYYVYKTIHVQASRSKLLHRALNITPWSWTTILHSLQCTFFIYIDRIFDTKRNPHYNIVDVVDTFVRYSHKYDRARFRQFIRLQHAITLYLRKVEPYRVIRKRVFAHPGYKHERDVKDLFKKTQIGQIESILRFLQRCVSSLRMYTLNDHDLALQQQCLPLQGNIVRDTKQMLNHLKYLVKPVITHPANSQRPLPRKPLSPTPR